MQNIETTTEQNIIENMEYSQEIKNLQTQLAEIDKQIQEERNKAKEEAKALILKFNIKPEELKDEEPETQQNEESPV